MVLDIQSWKLILNCANQYLIYIRRSLFCGIYWIILSGEKKGTDPERKQRGSNDVKPADQIDSCPSESWSPSRLASTLRLGCSGLEFGLNSVNMSDEKESERVEKTPSVSMKR